MPYAHKQRRSAVLGAKQQQGGGSTWKYRCWVMRLIRAWGVTKAFFRLSKLMRSGTLVICMKGMPSAVATRYLHTGKQLSNRA